MSSIRRTFVVAWNDGPKVTVTSNAWDMAAAQDYAHDEQLAAFALIHHALKRKGHSVGSLEDFIDLLDELEQPEKEEAEEVPTVGVDFGKEPLPYPSPQVLTPNAGLTITEDFSQQSFS